MPPHGPNFNNLMILYATRRAIPPGGGHADAVRFFTDSERFRAVMDQAEKDALEAINLIRSAPDNPYGADEEDIAKGIVEKYNERRAEQKRKK